MKTLLFPALKLTLLSVVLIMGIYTVAMLGIAQIFPNQGQGHKIAQNGQEYYSNIGQSFTQTNYFWSRPSAVDYDASGSGGSNLGPNNPVLLEMVQARIDTLMATNPGIKKSDIPVDLITASGSGLDPNMSKKAALLQVNRIAKVRDVSSKDLINLIEEHTNGALFGLFGPKDVINVLQLNLALDQMSAEVDVVGKINQTEKENQNKF